MNFMKEALEEAKKAYRKGEVPIGAVVELKGDIIGRGHNQIRELSDPTAHGEIMAIKQACKHVGYERLVGATMYVTCEPCIMCVGAGILARISKIVIGTPDEKTGACGSVYNMASENKLNHKIDVEIGILEEECRDILVDFFKELREEKRRNGR